MGTKRTTKFDVLNQVNDDTLIKVIRNGNICEIPKKDIGVIKKRYIIDNIRM